MFLFRILYFKTSEMLKKSWNMNNIRLCSFFTLFVITSIRTKQWNLFSKQFLLNQTNDLKVSSIKFLYYFHFHFLFISFLSIPSNQQTNKSYVHFQITCNWKHTRTIVANFICMVSLFMVLCELTWQLCGYKCWF